MNALRRNAHAVPKALLLLLLLPLAACTSAEQKCEASRAAARAAWTSYIDDLSAQVATAKQTVKSGQSTLQGSIEPRMAEEATKLANQRYIPGTEGWSRGRGIILIELCDKDAECKKIKRDMAEAQNLIEDVEERLPPATAARDALEGKAARAKAAADQAIIDPERPALKLAQTASVETQEACAEWTPPKAAE